MAYKASFIKKRPIIHSPRSINYLKPTGFWPHSQQLVLFFSGDKGKNLIVVFLL